MAGSVDSRVAQSPGGEFAPPSRQLDEERSSRSRDGGAAMDGATTTSVEEAAGCSGARDRGQVAQAMTERITDVSRQRGTDAVWSGVAGGPGDRPRTRRKVLCSSGVVAAGCVRARSPFAVTLRRGLHGARRGLARDPCGRGTRCGAVSCGATGPDRGAAGRQAGPLRSGPGGSLDHLAEDDHGARGALGPYPENRGVPRTRPFGADSCQGAGMGSGDGTGATRSRPGNRPMNRTTSPAGLFGRVTSGGADRSRDRAGRAGGENL
jgi:hypothetical protein